MTGVVVWTLKDWPDGAGLTCSNSTCDCMIMNGDRYIIVPETIMVLCYVCSQVEHSLDQAQRAMIAREDALLSPTRRLEVQRSRRPPRPRRLASGPERGKSGLGPPRLPHDPLRAAEAVSCPVCGQSFHPVIYAQARGRQTYCSPGCATQARRTNPDRTCVLCGTVFRPHAQRRDHQQRYCSAPCAMQARRKPRPLTCRVCNRTFTSTSTRPSRPQVYCSKSCRWYGTRNRENPSPPVLRWTRRYGACRCCGSTTRRHRGRGFCTACYQRHAVACSPTGSPDSLMARVG